MDAFYASVELLRYPDLKGLPVVIGGSRASQGGVRDANGEYRRLRDYKGRGVITTATYAARKFGVHSALGLMKAAQLCPDAILLPVDFEEYRKYSRLFKQVILEMTPLMEDRGVDEVYVEFTELDEGQQAGGRTLAERIQREIHESTGLTCSIGVAPNKLLAKMASEFNKPNGISIIYETDLRAKIWPLSCRKINGVGPKTAAKLEAHGISTIGELAARERGWLAEHFGPGYGLWLFESAWGWDERPVVTYSEPVSISRETTFERDLHAIRDRAELSEVFTDLCTRLAGDLQRQGYEGRTVGIKLKYEDFKGVTRDLTLDEFVGDAKQIRRAAGLCLKRAPLEKKLRLLGVRVGTLRKRGSGRVGEPAPGAVTQLELRDV
jgi:DNA polymerase-4